MTQEQEIKGILVNFFREGTKGDYMDALHDAIKEISQVKNCLIADAVKSLPTDDAEFIYSLLPKWVKDAPKGLNPTMYGTLTQEGDQKVIDRVKGILGNV